ncbi:putative fatty-acid--CoA ligase [Gordonia namibiensis NBRC 108229]|uniref:Putative fatty-acid--CoA ligase n=1 Tax=Gordonia namibiensis NBRC 108229 TaxID=1208314 RepID=K6XRG1_9ACTN|nr:AMP-binding protein [Gordonia namibiensis]GAC01400.1 putative fatty-acid--CoA ligase [Gordonia namibiensis NBRC 108229]
MTTLPEEIRTTARDRGATEVVFHSAVRPVETTTLAELYEQATAVAAGFRARGVGAGDVVAVQLPNWRECVVSHSAAWLLGATVLPIVSIYGPSELSFILRQSAAKVYIGPRTWRARDCSPLFDAASEIPTMQHLFVVNTPGEATTDRWTDFGRLLGQPAAGFEPYIPASSYERALLVYTSGTTADPKGVQHSHATLIAEVRSMEEHRGTGEETSCLAAFPSGHVAGVLGILRLLGRGATTVLMDAWDPAAAAELVATHSIESSAGAPIHLAGILEAADRAGLDVSSLTEYTTGAANVAADLIRRADGFGVRAFRCYGSTEHPTISSGSPDDPLDKRANTDGRITPGTEVLIVDENDQPVDPGVDGEILCRGPEQFLGYTDATLDTTSFADGWFRTGDVGNLDADGYLTITDRKKDIIVRGGENISSKEVEDTLLSHPAVAEAAAIGMPDERYGEKVCVFIVLRDGGVLDLDGIRDHFAGAGLARQKMPERLEIVDSLPRTASGKVRKPDLRAQIRELLAARTAP